MRPKIGLSTQRIEEIRRIATDLLRGIAYRGSAVPVERVANSLGATIRYAPYDGELAGMLIRSKDGAVIAVNSAHHKNRQRFTIAHECGHLVLHAANELFVDRSFAVFNRDQSSSKAENIQEVEANQFAAEILMPMRHVIRDIKKYNVDLEDDSQIKELSRIYSVSQQALTYRIANLFLGQYI